MRGLAAAALVLTACGGPRPSPMVDPDEGAVPAAHRPAYAILDEGLQMHFDPHVRRQEALEFAWSCFLLEAEDHPAGLVCPLKVKRMHIDVAEGPAGVSLVVRVGDPATANDLRAWYEEVARSR